MDWGHGFKKKKYTHCELEFKQSVYKTKPYKGEAIHWDEQFTL